MTGLELVAHMRESILDDVAVPYLWPDTELIRLLNYAEVQACRRAQLIIDSTTEYDNGTAGTAGQNPLCRLYITANQGVYRLSPKILQVKRVQLASMTYPIPGPVSYSELDERMSGWFGTVGTSGTSGTIGTAGSGGCPAMFFNEPNDTLAFVPAPSSDDVAYLVVSRLPLNPFSLRTSPEIDSRYHEALMDWAAHLAFMKSDSDTLNLELAGYYEQRFTATFGHLPDFYSERMRKTISQKARMRPREFGT